MKVCTVAGSRTRSSHVIVQRTRTTLFVQSTCTVVLSSVESEMYAFDELSVQLIFAQAILNEIGQLFSTHARADSSTARTVATKNKKQVVK